MGGVMERLFAIADRIKNTVNSVFVGKEDVVEKVLICLLAGGHVLLEDVRLQANKSIPFLPHPLFLQTHCSQYF